MKRITSLVLLLFFLAGNSNAALNIHYCGGKLESISMATKEKSCGMCGKATSIPCCKDIQKLLKADDFSKALFQTNVEKLFATFTSSVTFYFSGLTGKSIVKVCSLLPIDIPVSKTPLFIRICSLVI